LALKRLILFCCMPLKNFVIDAYTKRILARHNIIDSSDDYRHVQSMFERVLRPNVPKYNEYHALIVRLGKEYCRPNPLCEHCPLNNVHYSIKNKCHTCHKALPKMSDRKMKNGLMICAHCTTK